MISSDELAAREGVDEASLLAAEVVVEHEWEQFQHVTNDGGRANCQGDWPTFHQMRLAQFLTWPTGLVVSYGHDLDDADRTGRNLLTEKYARMMVTTEPERYRTEIEPALGALPAAREALQEQIIGQQVAWALDFRTRYPRLGAAMRTLRTSEDTLTDTSFETYLRGELSTYSDATLGGYRQMVATRAAAGANLTEDTLRWTVLLGGFADLADAEAALAGD